MRERCGASQLLNYHHQLRREGDTSNGLIFGGAFDVSIVCVCDGFLPIGGNNNPGPNPAP